MNYKRVYDAIIERAKEENRKKKNGIYYEAHHIVPKCLGGAGSYYKDKSHSNIVLLTGREHFLAHRLLCKMYPKNSKLVYALWSMCNLQKEFRTDYRPSARLYEEIRVKFSKMQENTIRPLEVREKISNTMTGRPAHNKGVKVRKEVLYKWQKPQEKVECPKCGKVGGTHAMKRFHFDKCGLAKTPLKEVQCPYCGKTGKGSMMKRWHFDKCKQNNKN